MANAVIEEILRQGRNKPRRHVLAALTTGRVESNFRNLPSGDADSVGWRQERASLYRNPRNLKASVRRFYQETAQHDSGQSVGELAADVQRPAAQYRGRYATHLDEAKQILQSGGGVTGRASGGGGGKRADLRFSPGQAVNLAQLLSNMRADAGRPQPGVTTPTAPAFSASAALPEGYQGVPSVGAPTPPSSDPLMSALQELSALGNTGVPGANVTGRDRQGGGGGGGGGGTPDVPGDLRELIWRGPGAQTVDNGRRVPTNTFKEHTDHVHVAGQQRAMVQLGKLAQRMGLRVAENPAFDPVDPVHTTGSYHYGRREGNRNYRALDVSGDTALMRKFAKRVTEAYRV